MNEASLPSPDTGANGYHLRRVAVKAIQSLDMVAPSYPLGSHPGAAKLAAFFDACRVAALEVGKRNATAMTLTPATSTGVVGSTQQLTVNKGGSTGAVTYRSTHPNIATVNASGLVTRVAPGRTLIWATMAADATYRERSLTADVAVTAA